MGNDTVPRAAVEALAEEVGAIEYDIRPVWVAGRLYDILVADEPERHTDHLHDEKIRTEALAAVAALHDDGDGDGWCVSCSTDWPCDTARVIADPDLIIKHKQVRWSPW